MRTPWGPRGALVTVAAALLLTTPLGAQAAGSRAARADLAVPGRGGPAVLALPQHPGPPGVPFARHPLLIKVRGYTASGRPILAVGAPGGYSAQLLRAYLRLHGSGAGQTVAIVDAFDDPYATSDINTYSAQFGLLPTCTKKHSTGCFHFKVVKPFGIGGLDVGWTAEESLDVDMVHALAPRASIVLVEARNNNDGPMFRAVGYASGLHPAVISLSWGSPEFKTESSDDHYCKLATGVCVAAAGDLGNPGLYPAFSPAVVAVGGTSLNLANTGAVTSEVAWSQSGGGISTREPRPAYQQKVNIFPNRGIPDVSFDADPATGVAVYDSAVGGWLEVGGTSVGAPAWAGIVAVADQLRAAHRKGRLTSAKQEVQRALYHLSGLFDVTGGSNGTCGAVCDAGPGYDFVTGIGSPRRGIDTALAAAP
jgi:hypothetical protein